MKRLIRLARNAIYHRAYIGSKSEEGITNEFHKLYYDSGEFDGTWKETCWLGVRTLKCPLDLWVYQEIMFDVRPDFIIEAGTHVGGSALFLATICDVLNHGQIFTIDIRVREGRPQHKRIEYILGSSIESKVIARLRADIKPESKVLVFLDSDHRCEHVLAELKTYAPMVSRGSYLIVEDTNLNGHPIKPEFGAGPMEAVDAFLAENSDFEIDTTRQKFYMTFNPRGYLRKK